MKEKDDARAFSLDGPSDPESDLCRPYGPGEVGVRWSLHNAIPDARLAGYRKRLHVAHSGKLRKALLDKLRKIRAGNWPTAAAIAASLLRVVTLPPNSAALVDQIVAAQLRAMAMLASAWLHARVEAQDGVASMVLLQIPCHESAHERLVRIASLDPLSL
jgi:hypothetical protein